MKLKSVPSLKALGQNLTETNLVGYSSHIFNYSKMLGMGFYLTIITKIKKKSCRHSYLITLYKGSKAFTSIKIRVCCTVLADKQRTGLGPRQRLCDKHKDKFCKWRM